MEPWDLLMAVATFSRTLPLPLSRLLTNSSSTVMLLQSQLPRRFGMTGFDHRVLSKRISF
jgi:hypothetical protein